MTPGVTQKLFSGNRAEVRGSRRSYTRIIPAGIRVGDGAKWPSWNGQLRAQAQRKKEKTKGRDRGAGAQK